MSSSKDEMYSHMYPPIEPFNSGHLKVSNIHSLYYEQSGNKEGIPVLYIHGGPGGCVSEFDRRYFDPKAYHIILFDQRGAGKSNPAYCLEENDTWSLVSDMEKLRSHLRIDRWLLFGGSWGSTLALAYGETHISHVLGLILRGIFTLRPEETAWLFQSGTSFLFPDKWEDFIAPIPPAERGDMVKAYYKRLSNDENKEERLKCAKAWSMWELSVSHLKSNVEEAKKKCEDETWVLAHSRIECHYFVNNGFLQEPNQLLDNASIIREAGVPVTIVQGRYDVVCPMKFAWELYKRLPHAEFHVVDDAGHSFKEIGISVKLLEACDKFKYVLQNLKVLR